MSVWREAKRVLYHDVLPLSVRHIVLSDRDWIDKESFNIWGEISVLSIADFSVINSYTVPDTSQTQLTEASSTYMLLQETQSV